MRPVARLAALFVVAPFLTFASALAPQHVHEPGLDPGHVTVHSHFGPHSVETRDLGNADGPEFDHDVDRVVWLESGILHESPQHSIAATIALPISQDVVQVDVSWSVTPFDDTAPVHGPPRRHASLRAPPHPSSNA
jgi:hypothetical protein